MSDETNWELTHTLQDDQQGVKKDLSQLQGNRAALEKKHGVLEKLHEGRLLSLQEERRWDFSLVIVAFL